jgi:hypothetical protein
MIKNNFQKLLVLLLLASFVITIVTACNIGELAALPGCKTYNHCADTGKWVLKKCRDGLLFDKNLKVCNWANMVKCE